MWKGTRVAFSKITVCFQKDAIVCDCETLSQWLTLSFHEKALQLIVKKNYLDHSNISATRPAFIMYPLIDFEVNILEYKGLTTVE